MNNVIEKWGPVLEHLNVPSEKIEKLSAYCEHHAMWENSYASSSDYNKNTLAIAIKVLNMIDINKVEFLNSPMDTSLYRISIPYNDENEIIHKVADFLNDKIENNNYFGIYLAVSNIFENEEVVEIESSPDMSVFSVRKMLNIETRIKIDE